MDYSKLRVIRGDPCRSNLRIRVTKVPTSEKGGLVKWICANIRRMIIRTEGGERAGIGFRFESSRFLVFCLAIKDLEEYMDTILENEQML